MQVKNHTFKMRNVIFKFIQNICVWTFVFRPGWQLLPWYYNFILYEACFKKNKIKQNQLSGKCAVKPKATHTRSAIGVLLASVTSKHQIHWISPLTLVKRSVSVLHLQMKPVNGNQNRIYSRRSTPHCSKLVSVHTQHGQTIAICHCRDSPGGSL